MPIVSGYKGIVDIPVVGLLPNLTGLNEGLEEWTLHHNIDEFEAVAKKQAFVETFFTAKEWDATIRFLVFDAFTDLGGWQMLSFDGADLSCTFTWEEGTTDWTAFGDAQIDDFDLFDPRDGPVELTLHVIGTRGEDAAVPPPYAGLRFTTGS